MGKLKDHNRQTGLIDVSLLGYQPSVATFPKMGQQKQSEVPLHQDQQKDDDLSKDESSDLLNIEVESIYKAISILQKVVSESDRNNLSEQKLQALRDKMEARDILLEVTRTYRREDLTVEQKKISAEQALLSLKMSDAYEKKHAVQLMALHSKEIKRARAPYAHICLSLEDISIDRLKSACKREQNALSQMAVPVSEPAYGNFSRNPIVRENLKAAHKEAYDVLLCLYEDLKPESQKSTSEKQATLDFVLNHPNHLVQKKFVWAQREEKARREASK